MGDEAASFLRKRISVRIDLPLGSKHPKWDLIFPINYGFVPGVFSADGEELDAYVLGITEPVTHFSGICVAIVHRLIDDDDKLILAPDGLSFTDEEIVAATAFQERYFKSIILR